MWSDDYGNPDGRRSRCPRRKEEVIGVKMFREGRGGMTRNCLLVYNFIILETAQRIQQNHCSISLKTNMNAKVLQKG